MPDPGNVQAYNRYGYALGNPMKYNDPTGHSVFDRHCLCGGGVTLAELEARTLNESLVTREQTALAADTAAVETVTAAETQAAASLESAESALAGQYPQAQPLEPGQAPPAANLSAGTTTTDGQTVQSRSNYVTDLVDPKATAHILDGETYPNGQIGGGHRYGTGVQGKSEFPESWSDSKILNNISDVVTDPDSIRQPPQPNGYQPITGIRDGVEIRVIYDTVNNRIVTGYPINLPRNR